MDLQQSKDVTFKESSSKDSNLNIIPREVYINLFPYLCNFPRDLINILLSNDFQIRFNLNYSNIPFIIIENNTKLIILHELLKNFCYVVLDLNLIFHPGEFSFDESFTHRIKIRTLHLYGSRKENKNLTMINRIKIVNQNLLEDFIDFDIKEMINLKISSIDFICSKPTEIILASCHGSIYNSNIIRNDENELLKFMIIGSKLDFYNCVFTKYHTLPALYKSHLKFYKSTLNNYSDGFTSDYTGLIDKVMLSERDEYNVWLKYAGMSSGVNNKLEFDMNCIISNIGSSLTSLYHHENIYGYFEKSKRQLVPVYPQENKLYIFGFKKNKRHSYRRYNVNCEENFIFTEDIEQIELFKYNNEIENFEFEEFSGNFMSREMFRRIVTKILDGQDKKNISEMGKNWFILVQSYYESLKLKDPTFTLLWDVAVWSEQGYRDFNDTSFMNNVHYKYWTRYCKEALREIFNSVGFKLDGNNNLIIS